MGQIFSPKSNAIAKLTIWLVVVFVFGGFALATGMVRSDYVTGEHEERDQPIPFSHKHHVKGLGLDCRFCHTGVERAAFAGIPDTETCMTCHAQIWKQSEVLKPVRDSYRQDEPLVWNKIYRLPGYVYFDHSIHVNRGIGCASCHGEVSEMPRIRQTRTFLMKDCVSCHEHPEQYLRPLDQIYNENWKPSSDLETQKNLMLQNGVRKQNLTDCGTCHR